MEAVQQKPWTQLIDELIKSGDIASVPDIEMLHPQAHVSAEMLEKLAFAIPVGNPVNPETGWMNENLNRTVPEPIEDLPVSFRNFYDSLPQRVKVEIDTCFLLISRIANFSKLAPDQRDQYSKDFPDVVNLLKKLYRFAEMRVMYLIKEQISNNIDPEKTLNLFALRGAAIFKGLFTGNQQDIEMKRLAMADGNYMVGVGKEFEALYNYPNKENIDTVVTGDDCLSTAMSELALIKAMKLAGFNLKRIIIPVTVAVGGGLRFLEREIKKLYPECILELAAGARCDAVNNLMYLMRDLEKFFVGDMGFFNEFKKFTVGNDGNSEIPTGEYGIQDAAVLNGVLSRGILDPAKDEDRRLDLLQDAIVKLFKKPSEA